MRFRECDVESEKVVEMDWASLSIDVDFLSGAPIGRKLSVAVAFG